MTQAAPSDGDVTQVISPTPLVDAGPVAPVPLAAHPAVGAPQPPKASQAPLSSLEVRNISAWFGDHNVLDRVSLTMPGGVVTSLIGPSG